MEFIELPPPACFLVDNGSLRPAATRTLRRISAALSQRLSRPVEPVSLLHSDRIPAVEIDGVPGETWEAATRQRYAQGQHRFLILPLFFGPSAALTEYLPDRIAALTRELPSLEVRIAAAVAGTDPASPDPRIARILADQVRACSQQRQLRSPRVILVDHGSPQRAVAVLRDRIATQLATALDRDANVVSAASMERRADADYDFNEPLLAGALDAPARAGGAGDVVIAPLFFSPGRHAGPGGDIEAIARAAETRAPGLRVHLAPLVGEHPLLIDVLADRGREALA